MEIVEINNWPVGEPLERPLHPKRSRRRSPRSGPSSVLEVLDPAPSGSSCESPLSTLPQDVPSPSTYVECGASPRTPRSIQHEGRTLWDEETQFYLTYGSEEDSEDSDQEESLVAPMSRRLQVLLDTPDDADIEPDQAPLIAQEPIAPVSSEAFEPSTFFDFQWKSFPDPLVPPEQRRETFSDINVGPSTPIADPYESFTAIWDQHIMEHIVSETNRYAQDMAHQLFQDNNLHPNSRIAGWVDTSVDELYTFLAIVLAMGIMVKSRMEDYWCAKSGILSSPGFRAQMSLRRFQILSRCLHFNNNRDICARGLGASEARLFKIGPIISHLNSKFQSLYTMGQNIALDESLLQWKGWLDINQFVPNKAASVGIKTYELCESQTGYLWRFEVHAHKKSRTTSEDPLDAFTPTTVLRLLRGLENKGHTIWMDNFYNSPALARRLKSIGIDCVGTLRTNRRFVPEALSQLTKAQMRRGQIAGCTSGDVDVMVWRDQNQVATISTYHGNAITLVQGVPKPTLILDYNIMMGGVDKKDQMLAMYPIERKRTKVWYKKLFRRLLNVSVLNAYIICKKSSPSLSHRSFRTNLIYSILNKHSFHEPTPTPNTNSKTDVRHHHLAEYPFLPGGSGRGRRLCSVCKKRVQMYCVGCNKPCCFTPCFVSLHT